MTRHMSEQRGHPHPAATTYHDAEVLRIEHVLASYGGTLTRDTLREFCGADAWRDTSFDAALHDAVRAGRIKELTPELYRTGDDAA
jgi:hypothetical protein